MESLAYTLRGLMSVLTKLLHDGPPSAPKERVRYNEMVGSVARCAELHSMMMASASTGISKPCTRMSKSPNLAT